MAEKAARIAKCTRTTNETDITLEFNIDGKGQSKIDTGIGFFDHMLTSFAKHGFFDLNVTVKGDLYVDCHHTIEDVGIVLGKAIKDIDIDNDKAFKGIEAIIMSMTPEERDNPEIINGSRRKRIADGSGTNVAEVNKLLKQFETTRKMMKTALTGNLAQKLRGFRR